MNSDERTPHRDPVKRACVPCARAKRKCDGKSPCGRCAHKKKPHFCTYEQVVSKRKDGSTPGRSNKRARTEVTNQALETKSKKADISSMPAQLRTFITSTVQPAAPIASTTISAMPRQSAGTEGKFGSSEHVMAPNKTPISGGGTSEELADIDSCNQSWNDSLSASYDYTGAASLKNDATEYQFEGEDYYPSYSKSPLQQSSNYVPPGEFSAFSSDVAEEEFTDDAPELFGKDFSAPPDAMLEATTKQFDRSSHPNQLSELHQVGRHIDDEADSLQEGSARSLIKRCLYTTLGASPIPCCRITYDTQTMSLTSVFFNAPCCQLFGLDSKRLRRLMYLSKEFSWVDPREVENRVVRGYLKSAYNRSPTIMYRGRYLHNTSSPAGDPSVEGIQAEVDTNGQPKRYTFHVYEACVANEIEWHPGAGAVSRTIWYTQPQFTGEAIELNSFSSIWANTYKRLRSAVSDATLRQIGYFVSPTQPIHGQHHKAAFPHKDRPVFDALNGVYDVVEYSASAASDTEDGVSACGNRYSIENDPHYLLVNFQTVGAGDAFAPLDRLASTVASSGIRVPISDGRIH